MSVQGLKAVTAAIKAHEPKMVKGLRVGLLRAGLFLQRESQKVVPVDRGILRSTANTRIEGKDLDSSVVVSYGTEYAIYVHENLNARHKPGTYAKYLTRPLATHKAKLQSIVMKSMQEHG